MSASDTRPWKRRQHFINFASPIHRTCWMCACHSELPLPWDFSFSPAWRLPPWSLLSSKLCMSVPSKYRLIYKLIHILFMHYIHFLISKVTSNHHFTTGHNEKQPMRVTLNVSSNGVSSHSMRIAYLWTIF